MKRNKFKIVLILFLLVFTIITCGEVMAIERGPNWEKTETEDGTLMTFFNKNVNIEYDGEYIPYEDYVDMKSVNNSILFTTIEKKQCTLSLDYKVKTTLADMLGRGEKETIDIFIKKNRGSYYFTTNISRELDNISYVFDCDGKFYNNKLFLLDGDVVIDFNEAKNKQNITASYDKENKKIKFKGDKLKYIDPDVQENYTSVGTQDWTVPAGVSEVEVLVVAGGGGGADDGLGSALQGGGGAGGVIYNSSYAVTSGTNVTIVVGGGGQGQCNAGTCSSENGDDSSFGTLTAVGGGRASSGVDGYDGGSGGGGSYSQDGGSGTSGQGYDGGNGGTFMDYDGGGGGGCSEAGDAGSAASNGAGGDGCDYSTEFGTDYGESGVFGGGGSSQGGNGGGNGGGGNAGQDGTDGTGGGGGGGSNGGGDGGDGVVLFKYSQALDISIQDESFNATEINGGESIRLNLTTNSSGGDIDVVSMEMKYPNGTLKNFSMDKLRYSEINDTGDQESGEQTNVAQNTPSSCTNSGPACSTLGNGPCQACPGCSWSSCPFVYSWNGEEWIFEHEAFSTSPINFPIFKSRATMEELKCDDGKYKIEIREVLRETSTFKDIEWFAIENTQGTIYLDTKDNFRRIADLYSPTKCLTDSGEECLFNLSFIDEKSLYLPYRKGVKTDTIILDFENPNNEDTAKLFFTGKKTKELHEVFTVWLNKFGTSKPLRIMSKIPGIGAIGRWYIDKLMPKIYVWNGQEWVFQDTLHDFAPRYVYEERVVFLEGLTKDAKVKVVYPNAFFEIDYIGIDYSSDDNINPRRIEPTSMKFNGKDISTIKNQQMKLSDRINIEFNCVDNADIVGRFSGYYIPDEGNFQEDIFPKEPMIKALWSWARVFFGDTLGILDQAIDEHELYIYQPCGACSGTINCPTHNSDQSSCEGCSICTWNAAVNDEEANKTIVDYADVSSSDITGLSKINVTVVVSGYDKTGSDNAGNTQPKIVVAFYDGSGWTNQELITPSAAGTYSVTTTDATTLTAWATNANRDLKVRAAYLDFDTVADSVNWTGVTVYITGDKWQDDWFKLDFTDTDQEGQYNVSKVFVNDTEGTTNHTDYSLVGYWLNFSVASTAVSYGYNISQAITISHSEKDLSDIDKLENVGISLGQDINNLGDLNRFSSQDIAIGNIAKKIGVFLNKVSQAFSLAFDKIREFIGIRETEQGITMNWYMLDDAIQTYTQNIYQEITLNQHVSRIIVGFRNVQDSWEMVLDVFRAKISPRNVNQDITLGQAILRLFVGERSPNQDITIGQDITTPKSLWKLFSESITFGFDKSTSTTEGMHIYPSITPASPTQNDDLIGWCNATDPDSDNVTFEWKWYNGSDLFSNGSEEGELNNYYWCYQEFVNQSDGDDGSCSLFYNQTYNDLYGDPEIYDGDWSTDSLYWEVYMNYTKPTDAANNSLWQVKYDDGLGEDIYNFSIAQGCWDYSGTQLNFWIKGGGAGGGVHHFYCQNSSGWATIHYGSTKDVFEEAMWWSVENNTASTWHTSGELVNLANITSNNTAVGETWTFACNATDGTDSTGWSNTSVSLFTLTEKLVNQALSIGQSITKYGEFIRDKAQSITISNIGERIGVLARKVADSYTFLTDMSQVTQKIRNLFEEITLSFDKLISRILGRDVNQDITIGQSLWSSASLKKGFNQLITFTEGLYKRSTTRTLHDISQLITINNIASEIRNLNMNPSQLLELAQSINKHFTGDRFADDLITLNELVEKYMSKTITKDESITLSNLIKKLLIAQRLPDQNIILNNVVDRIIDITFKVQDALQFAFEIAYNKLLGGPINAYQEITINLSKTRFAQFPRNIFQTIETLFDKIGFWMKYYELGDGPPATGPGTSGGGKGFIGYCGDGVCNKWINENSESCPEDCGEDVEPPLATIFRREYDFEVLTPLIMMSGEEVNITKKQEIRINVTNKANISYTMQDSTFCELDKYFTLNALGIDVNAVECYVQERPHYTKIVVSTTNTTRTINVLIEKDMDQQDKVLATMFFGHPFVLGNTIISGYIITFFIAMIIIGLIIFSVYKIRRRRKLSG